MYNPPERAASKLTSTMITVHHLETSRSQRVLWLLEELGVPYELKIYQRDKATRLAPPELKKIHPLGKSPVITDGDEVIAESGAIIEYLAETYGANAGGDLAHLQPARGTPAHRQAACDVLPAAVSAVQGGRRRRRAQRRHLGH